MYLVPDAPDARVTDADLCEITITAPDADWLTDLCRRLVDAHLAASAHVIHPITSIYRWEGTVHETTEARAFLRSRIELLDDLTAYVVDRHPYAVPNVAPASGLLSRCAMAVMVPAAAALGAQLPERRAVRTTRAAGVTGHGRGAASGPLLVASLLPFEVETPISVTAVLVLADWILLVSHWLRGSAAFSRRTNRLGRLLGRVQLSSAATTVGASRTGCRNRRRGVRAGLPDRRLHLRRPSRRAGRPQVDRPDDHGMVSAAALVAWLPRADVVLSLVLLAVGTVQIALVDGLPVGRRVAPSRRAVRARRPSWPAAALRRVGSR
jgi:periplasmic divalent cation tolerance protein